MKELKRAFSLAPLMTRQAQSVKEAPASRARSEGDAVALFRRRFQQALRECLRHGFCMEESFGMIWDETVDEIPLRAREEKELFHEMLEWARECLRTGGVPSRNEQVHVRVLGRP